MSYKYIAKDTNGSILFTETSVKRAVDSVVAHLTAGCSMSFDGGETWEESKNPVSTVNRFMRGKSNVSVMFSPDRAIGFISLTKLQSDPKTVMMKKNKQINKGNEMNIIQHEITNNIKQYLHRRDVVVNFYKNNEKYDSKWTPSEKFLWYALDINKELFRNNPESFFNSYKTSGLEKFVEENKIFIFIEDTKGKIIKVGYFPYESETLLAILLEEWIDSAFTKKTYGTRENCPEYISEMIPCLFDHKYYRSFPFCKENGKGDGFYFYDGKIQDVENKFTTSGGARQTFSKNQVDTERHYVISFDNYSKCMEDWYVNKKCIANFSFYDCTCQEYKELMLKEIEMKDKRNGTGRYEISNLISKIEKQKLYVTHMQKILTIGDENDNK